MLASPVNVERVFSKGRILLSHLPSPLSVQSLMCLGVWSNLRFIQNQPDHVKYVTFYKIMIGI
jgi:hypothetical protein